MAKKDARVDDPPVLGPKTIDALQVGWENVMDIEKEVCEDCEEQNPILEFPLGFSEFYFLAVAGKRRGLNPIGPPSPSLCLLAICICSELARYWRGMS